MCCFYLIFFFFSSRRRHTRFDCDWSSDVCSSDLCWKTCAITARRALLVIPIRPWSWAAARLRQPWCPAMRAATDSRGVDSQKMTQRLSQPLAFSVGGPLRRDKLPSCTAPGQLCLPSSRQKRRALLAQFSRPCCSSALSYTARTRSSLFSKLHVR